MMHVSSSVFEEILLNAKIQVINRPEIYHEFRPGEMLICSIPSENGPLFVICHNARDIICIPKRFVAWFLAENFSQMNGTVIVSPCDPAVYRAIYRNPPNLDGIGTPTKRIPKKAYCPDQVLIITGRVPEQAYQINPGRALIITERISKQAYQISPRVYWNAQHQNNPNARCPNRFRGPRKY